MAMGVICRTRHIECIFKDRGGRLLLLSFNEMGMRANGSAIWAGAPAAELGISTVGFITTEPNWFPARDMQYCLTELEKVIGKRFKQRVAIGMSQGAYAAIKYSVQLKVKTVLAFSPQVSIDPVDIVDSRFNHYFRRDIHSHMKIDAADRGGADIYMFYDPYDAGDAEHCSLIAQSLPVVDIRLPFAGHGSIRPFTGTAYFAELIKHCVGHDVPALRNLYHRVKARNRSRPFLITMALAQRHPSVALRIFDRYKDGEPFLEWRHAAYRLAVAGKAASIVEWIVSIADRHQEHDEVQACMARIALEMGDRTLGTPYAERALRLRPENTAYVWLKKELAELPVGRGRKSSVNA